MMQGFDHAVGIESHWYQCAISFYIYVRGLHNKLVLIEDARGPPIKRSPIPLAQEPRQIL